MNIWDAKIATPVISIIWRRKKSRQKCEFSFYHKNQQKKHTKKVKFHCDKSREWRFPVHSHLLPLQSTTRTALVCNNRMLWKKKDPRPPYYTNRSRGSDKKMMDAESFSYPIPFWRAETKFWVEKFAREKSMQLPRLSFPSTFYNVHLAVESEKNSRLRCAEMDSKEREPPPPQSAIIHHCVRKIMTDRTLFCGWAGR